MKLQILKSTTLAVIVLLTVSANAGIINTTTSAEARQGSYPILLDKQNIIMSSVSAGPDCVPFCDLFLAES